VPRDAGTLVALLDRAARLADAGLFFEVHELLEPAWLRSEGSARLALQGLIQVAVGFHHAAHGNREGAVSLLAEGVAKLGASAPSLPLDTAAWLGRLEAVLTAWRAGSPAPAPTPWPAPTETAWRSS
jgi:predicted metal-dependent hydrolase